MAKTINGLIRSSREFKDVINYIKAKYLLEGKHPPTTAEITKMIARKVNKEEVFKDEFIKF